MSPNAPSTRRLLYRRRRRCDDRETFARILTLEGYEVRTATNAESGLREIESGYPDAVILDLRMPFINGLGPAVSPARLQPDRQTPVVVVTGDQCLDDSVIASFAILAPTSASSRSGSKTSSTSPGRSCRPAASLNVA